MTLATSGMNRADRRAAMRRLQHENTKYGDKFLEVDISGHARPATLIRAWRNRHFLVQEYAPEKKDMEMVLVRLSINRTDLAAGQEQWQDGITWDELQKIKNDVGYAECDAVEVYPRRRDLVLAAHMRHLFVLTGLLPFAWRKGA